MNFAFAVLLVWLVLMLLPALAIVIPVQAWLTGKW